VLKGAHRARIHIKIRIAFDKTRGQTTGFKQFPDGRCGNAFSQTGNNTPGYKNKFTHSVTPVLIIKKY